MCIWNKRPAYGHLQSCKNEWAIGWNPHVFIGTCVTKGLDQRRSICRMVAAFHPVHSLSQTCSSLVDSHASRITPEILSKKSDNGVHLVTFPSHTTHLLRAGLAQWVHRLASERSGHRIPVEARFSTPVQYGPEAHPASYTMSTGSFPGGKAAGPWRWPPTPIWRRS